MREVISLHVGQGGIQLGDTSWKLFCLEHDITCEGNQSQYYQQYYEQDNFFHAYFSEDKEKKFRPRAIHIDLQPDVINSIRKGHQRKLYNQQNLIIAKGGSGSNFARGHSQTVGMAAANLCLQRVRKQAQKCGNFEGFLIYNSLGGGTGGGLGSLLLQRLSDEFNGKTKVGFNIFSSPKTQISCVQSYNTVLAQHYILKHQDISIVLDNQAIHNICHRLLDIDHPFHKNYINIMSQIVSIITGPTRYTGRVSMQLSSIQTDMIPYPRFRFLLPSYSPLYPPQCCCVSFHTSDLVDQTFKRQIVMATCDPRKGKHLACSLFFRGDHSIKDINELTTELRVKKTFKFADWCHQVFKVYVNYQAPRVLPGGDLCKEMRTLGTLSNTTAISSFLERFNKDFDKMYSKKAFMHWYTKEGMQEGQFVQAREDMKQLQDDYRIAEEETEIEEF